MSKFIKGQWYIIGNDYYEYNEERHTWLGENLHWFRKAGELDGTPFGDPIATPSSLIPDFSDAKAGDECFSVEEGICKIMDGKSDSLIAAMNKDGGWDAFTMNGKLEPESTHPLLYNSFAQFKAYWAEQALLMATQRTKS